MADSIILRNIEDIVIYILLIGCGIFYILMIYFAIKTKKVKLTYPNGETATAISTKWGKIQDWLLQWYWKVKKSNKDSIKGIFKDGLLEEWVEKKHDFNDQIVQITYSAWELEHALVKQKTWLKVYVKYIHWQIARTEFITPWKKQDDIQITDISSHSAKVVFKGSKHTLLLNLIKVQQEIACPILLQAPLWNTAYYYHLLEHLEEKTKYAFIISTIDESWNILTNSNTYIFTTA